MNNSLIRSSFSVIHLSRCYMTLDFERRTNFYLVDLNLGLIWYRALPLKISFWGSFRYTAKKQYILSFSDTALILLYFPKHFLANFCVDRGKNVPTNWPRLGMLLGLLLHLSCFGNICSVHHSKIRGCYRDTPLRN